MRSSTSASSTNSPAQAEPRFRRPTAGVSEARALVTDPTPLWLDEPLGALTSARQHASSSKRIQREVGITFVTDTRPGRTPR